MSERFHKANRPKDIQKIFDYNIDVFSDTPDFHWDLKSIKKEISDGWELYSFEEGEEIIAAVFVKKGPKGLLTKNTSIKLTHQGSGFSHEIKKFFEEKAKEYKTKKIFHYCSIDNFRAYSLNESHGYSKTDTVLDEGKVVEWVKEIK